MCKIVYAYLSLLLLLIYVVFYCIVCCNRWFPSSRGSDKAGGETGKVQRQNALCYGASIAAPAQAKLVLQADLTNRQVGWCGVFFHRKRLVSTSVVGVVEMSVVVLSNNKYQSQVGLGCA